MKLPSTLLSSLQTELMTISASGSASRYWFGCAPLAFVAEEVKHIYHVAMVPSSFATSSVRGHLRPENAGC
jgi:hypothetical protein